MCYVTACFLYFPWFWGYVKSQCNLYSKQWQKTAFTRMYYNCLSLFLRPCLPYCCISTVIIMWVHQVSAHAFWRCFVLLLKATKVQGNCHHVFFFMTEWSVPMMSLWWDWGWGFPHRWLLYTSCLSQRQSLSSSWTVLIYHLVNVPQRPLMYFVKEAFTQSRWQSNWNPFTCGN